MRWRVIRIIPPPPPRGRGPKGDQAAPYNADEVSHRGDKGVDHQVATPVWASRIEVDGAPLLEDASIRDFQLDIAGYVADVVE